LGVSFASGIRILIVESSLALWLLTVGLNEEKWRGQALAALQQP
jgi:hypothetical protein